MNELLERWKEFVKWKEESPFNTYGEEYPYNFSSFMDWYSTQGKDSEVPSENKVGDYDLYMVVGQDMVTKWLQEGWELYGSPMFNGNNGWTSQAIVKRNHPNPDSETNES